jgi:hypothetical protein
MLRSTLAALALWALAAASHALSPYVHGERVEGTDLWAQLAQVEGIKSDGSVSDVNPGDWCRAHLRGGHAAAEPAVRTVQASLARGVGATVKVYEVVLPQHQLAVFGVALNDADTGEGGWAGQIGPDRVAALPYGIDVVGGKVDSPYARDRIALAWAGAGQGPVHGHRARARRDPRHDAARGWRRQLDS